MTNETLEKIRTEFDRVDRAIDNLERIIEESLDEDEVKAIDDALNNLVGGKGDLEQFIADADQALADNDN